MMDELDVSCFSELAQHFLVCITVHKARHLSVMNANTFVLVILDKSIKRTSIYKNSDCPFFNEYFVFELDCSLQDLLRLNVTFSVFRKTFCAKKNEAIGDFMIDLTTVWSEANHCFFKKWGQLENPLGIITSDLPRGYLQLDISIISKYEKPAPAMLHVRDYDEIDTNMLQPFNDGIESEKCKYVVSIFKGEFVEKFVYIIQVQFTGIIGKTKPSKSSRSPEWNEQIEFNWFYPSICETFRIQVMINDCCIWRPVTEFDIHFTDITHKVKTQEPDIVSFGPTYVHFYDNVNSNYYIGRILLKIDMIDVLENSVIRRKAIISQILPLLEQQYWPIEQFVINLSILELNSIATSSNKIKIQLSCGESTSNELELQTFFYTDSKLKYVKFPSIGNPLLTLKTKLPDYRLKYESNIALRKLLISLTNRLEMFKQIELKLKDDFQYQLKFLKWLIDFMKTSIEQTKTHLYFKVFMTLTKWDKCYESYLINKVNALMQNLNQIAVNEENIQFNIEQIYTKLQNIAGDIVKLLGTKLQDVWPDLILKIFNGGYILAYYRVDSKRYFYSQNPDCKGDLCAKRHNIIFKPNKCKHSCEYCGCIYGLADIFIWIGTELESNDWLPNGFQLIQNTHIQVTSMNNFKCNMYLHQGKIRPGSDKNGLCDGSLEVTFLNQVASTKVIYDSLSPIWNEVITFNCLNLQGNEISYKTHPPLIMIQLYDFNRKKKSKDLIGTTYVCPSVCLLSNDIDIVDESQVHNENYTTNVAAAEIELKAESMDIRQNLRNNLVKLRKAGKKLDKVFRKTQVESQNNDYSKHLFPPPLRWISISKNGVSFAEILISAELIQIKSSSSSSEMLTYTVGIPQEICPTMKMFNKLIDRIQVTFAGLRDAIGFPKNTIGRYKIEITFGELLFKSGPSAQINRNSINFLDPFISGTVLLPDQLKYWPPLIVKHLECIENDITIGATMISKPDKFLVEKNFTQSFLVSNYSEMDVELGQGENEPLLQSEDKFKRKLNIKNQLEKLGDLNVPSLSLFLKKSTTFKENTEKFDDKKQIYEADYSWWTKFYNSIKMVNYEDSENSKHQLTIFDSELENEPQFNYLHDWAIPISLLKGTSNKNDKENSIKENSYCTLKCDIKIKKFNNLTEQSIQRNSYIGNRYQQISSLISEIPILIRVYIVQAINLRSMDTWGYSDSYIQIEYGNQKISDRAHYIPNQTNPIYGKKFQVKGIIPRDILLTISVYDRDEGIRDDLIGSTTIDIEDRLRTRHHAVCGIANEYSKSGYNIWRDISRPSEILQQICKKHNLGSYVFVGNRIQVAEITFDDTTKIAKNEDSQERLCLSVLKQLDKIPAVGYKLIPEHVETRSLYRKDRPGIEQGKLQMWIEIYDRDKIPPPIDLTPQPPRLYELRVIIWNTADVILNETNIFGKSMSDIYIKGWLCDSDTAQCTDIHYRSLTGEGNFNWRMIFPLKYSTTEDMMVITKKKSVYEKFDTSVKVPTILNIQIWDNDALSADDFLGSISLNLSHFSIPTTKSSNCVPSKISNYENLFFKKNIRGWFVCHGYMEDGKLGQTGKIEMELEILTDEEANANPAGLGRDGPNPLTEPNRPDTSFNWYSNPIKSLKQILWPKIRKTFLYCSILFLIIFIVIVAIVTIPGKLLNFSTGGTNYEEQC